MKTYFNKSYCLSTGEMVIVLYDISMFVSADLGGIVTGYNGISFRCDFNFRFQRNFLSLEENAYTGINDEVISIDFLVSLIVLHRKFRQKRRGK